MLNAIRYIALRPAGELVAPRFAVARTAVDAARDVDLFLSWAETPQVFVFQVLEPRGVQFAIWRCVAERFQAKVDETNMSISALARRRNGFLSIRSSFLASQGDSALRDRDTLVAPRKASSQI